MRICSEGRLDTQLNASIFDACMTALWVAARRRAPSDLRRFPAPLGGGLLEEGAHATVEAELALEVAIGRVLERNASFLEDPDEHLDQRAIELGTRHPAKLGDRLLRRHRLAIRVA